MGVQKRIAQLGFAKQTAKGAAATDPTYTIGLTGGNVYSAEVDQSELNTTWSTRGLAGHERLSVVPGADFEAVAMPKSIGLLLYLACGAVATTGTSPAYTHTIKPSAGLPWATLFGLYGADKTEMHDVKVDSIELSWDKSGSVKVKVTALGVSFAFDSAWTVTTTGETVAQGTFKAGGGTIQVNGAAARVTAGSIKIENGAEAIVSSAITPDDVFEGDVKCDVSLTILPDDLTLFRRVITGTDNGTSISADVSYGTVSIEFVNGTNSLTFDAPNAALMVEMPEADPAGGAAELSLEGSCALATDGSEPFTFALINDVASY